MNNRPVGNVSDTVDKATQNKAIAVVVVIIALLFLFSAFQTGLLKAPACMSAPPESPESDSTGSSASDAAVPNNVSSSDEVLSDSDAVSSSDVNVVYYPEVHIEGLTLPAEYGAGLFDADAAMWLINEYRRQSGLEELLPGQFGLEQVTRIRLEEAVQKFSHERPDGTAFDTVYDQTGLPFRFCAENLALGQFTAEEVVRDWIESDTHRENLLSTSVTHMCVMTDMCPDGRAVWVFEAYAPPSR